MKHEISYGNWLQELAGTIETAESGDTIVCHTEAMAELAERARARMTPDKQLCFEVEEAP